MKGHASLLFLEKHQYFLNLILDAHVFQDDLMNGFRFHPLQYLAESFDKLKQIHFNFFFPGSSSGSSGASRMKTSRSSKGLFSISSAAFLYF